MKLSRRQLRRLITETMAGMLTENMFLILLPKAERGELDTGEIDGYWGSGQITPVQRQQLQSINDQASADPGSATAGVYGKTLDDAKNHARETNKVVHWVQEVEGGGEKIYVVHKPDSDDVVGLRGTGPNYVIPTEATVLYSRKS